MTIYCGLKIKETLRFQRDMVTLTDLKITRAARTRFLFEAFLLQQVLQEDLQRQALRCGDEPGTVVLHQGRCKAVRSELER